MKQIKSAWLILSLVFVLALAGLSTSSTAAQDQGTATPDDFQVIPPVDEEIGEPSPSPTPSPTPEVAPIVVDQATATPAGEADEAFPEGWTLPINLSRSGATADPQVVRDSSGVYHVLWRDAIDGLIYSRGNGEEWSPPVSPELPFSTRRYFPELEPEDDTPQFVPLLVADDTDTIHAFWSDDSEGRETLYHSSVASGSFADFEAWSERDGVDDAARKVSAAIDDAGVLHLVYIRPNESAVRPSGVYYRRLEGGVWSDAVLLYPSRYMRDLDADEANLQILAENGRVYVVWDDTRREQVFFARSGDGGRSWEAPREIDRRSRDDEAGSAGPSQIVAGSQGDLVVLSWRGGHEAGRSCAQYEISSNDGGVTWSLREHLELLPGCLESAKLIANERGLFLMGSLAAEGGQSSVSGTPYLLAWDGGRWSEPQLQGPLESLNNPDTFQSVELSCLQVLGEGTMLRIVGCDQGSGQDIWTISRDVGLVDDWFPPPSVWIGPDRAAAGQVDTDGLQIVADELGRAHAFWIGDEGASIYYAGWDGQSWSAPRPIFEIGNGSVEQISTAASGERLYLVWHNSETGLTFSNAASDRPSEWSDPQALVSSEPAAGAPSIAVNGDGRIRIAYAVPLNEDRGIYFIESSNQGESWSMPTSVFDGAEAGWEMVDQPRLAITDNGQLHLMWTRRSLPPNGGPEALAYSRSYDKGATWSEVEMIEDAEAVWSRLLGTGDYGVHRLWAEERADRLTIWHQVSEDGGLSWSRAAQVVDWSVETDPAAVVDAGERPHLVAIEDGRLTDLLWQDGRWTSGEDLAVPFAPGGELAAAGTYQVQLIVLHSGHIPGAGGEETEADYLYFMWRPFDVSLPPATPQPTLTPSPAPSATPAATATPQPTATIAFATEPENTSFTAALTQLPSELGQNRNTILTAAVPLGLILLLAILVGIRLARRR